jgi:hypothetical protein
MAKIKTEVTFQTFTRRSKRKVTTNITHQIIAFEQTKTTKSIKKLLGRDPITIRLNLTMKTLQQTEILQANSIKYLQRSSSKAKLTLQLP